MIKPAFFFTLAISTSLEATIETRTQAVQSSTTSIINSLETTRSDGIASSTNVASNTGTLVTETDPQETVNSGTQTRKTGTQNDDIITPGVTDSMMSTASFSSVTPYYCYVDRVNNDTCGCLREFFNIICTEDGTVDVTNGSQTPPESQAALWMRLELNDTTIATYNKENTAEAAGAEAIGSLGLVLMILFISLFIFFDITNIKKYLQPIKRNINSLKKSRPARWAMQRK